LILCAIESKNSALQNEYKFVTQGNLEIEGATNSSPKVVYFNDNGLENIDFTLLEWSQLELLALFRNPWVCDCHLQWVAEFLERKPSEATMLADPDFT